MSLCEGLVCDPLRYGKFGRGLRSELLTAPRSPTSSPGLASLQETKSERLLASPTLGRVLVPCAAKRLDVGHTVVVVLVQGTAVHL